MKVFSFLIIFSLFANFEAFAQVPGQDGGLCAVCMISKSKKEVCYFRDKGKDGIHDIDHILMDCSMHPCVRQRGLGTINEAKRRKVPVKSSSEMWKVDCD